MKTQDEFYLANESNAFYERWLENPKQPKGQLLRDSKKQILNQISECLDVNNLKVLEVGCFIGDLLGHLKVNHGCEVHGIESSSKACQHAMENFDVKLENATFAASSLFKLSEDNHEIFDLIICEDVLSWMSRDQILPILGVLDWMLTSGGSIFIRDFSPAFGFAYENHHCPGQNVYNFKQPGGHRQFFLNTGKYVETSSYIRASGQYQKIDTGRPDSTIWADSLITKCQGALHPILPMDM